MNEFLEVLLDAVIDTLKLVPFLFAAYLLLEYIEHRSSKKLSDFLTNSKFGVPGGAVLGCIPQCGMSVAASHIFASGAIGGGTLVAVFLSTSDEAVPVLLANIKSVGIIIPLILLKVAFAVIAGYIFDLIFRKVRFKGGHKGDHDCDRCEEIHEAHDHKCGEKCESNIFVSALKRSLSVIGFIFAVTLVMSVAVWLIGEENIAAFAEQNKYLQPLFAALVGLIPNCASSVILTELLVSGTITFGAAFSGLSVGAGIGYAAMFAANKHPKENLLIIAYCFTASVLAGMLITAAEALF
ncbi:MAG: arsenic efflux protein [Clostridia bacterium]|nr:arsenic efflux protein [Clostridia bacterium]